MVYKFFGKKSAPTCANKTGINCYIVSEDHQLADELDKPITRNLKNVKYTHSLKFGIWGADLADMQLISKDNKGIQFLSCVIDIFSKYPWVVPLKDNKGITIANVFQKF